MATKGTPLDKKYVTQDPDKNNNKKKFKIHKSDAPAEIEADVDVEVVADGDYQVDKLPLPSSSITFKDGTPPKDIPIRWFTNFAIKENNVPINKTYHVTIPGLDSILAKQNSKLVVYYGSGNPVAISHDGDTITLTNGDPAPGMAP